MNYEAATRRFLLAGLWTLLASLVLPIGCASSQPRGDEPSGEQRAEVGEPPAADDPDSEPKSPPEGPYVDISDTDAGERVGARYRSGSRWRTDSHDCPDRELHGAWPVVRTDCHKRVEPHRINGSFAGFEIVALHPSAKRFVDPALTVGDVITHINGVRMKKPDDYLAAWKLLDDVDAVRIDFLRDGVEEQAVWRVEDAQEASAASDETGEQLE